MVLISEYFRYCRCGTCHSAWTREKLLGCSSIWESCANFLPVLGSWMDLNSKGAWGALPFLPTPPVLSRCRPWSQLLVCTFASLVLGQNWTWLSWTQQLLVPTESFLIALNLQRLFFSGTILCLVATEIHCWFPILLVRWAHPPLLCLLHLQLPRSAVLPLLRL